MSKWSYHILLRYTLYQLPELAALAMFLVLFHVWFDLKVWLAWTIAALWIVKDAVIYPFVWRAYDSSGPDVLAGAQGKALEDLSPSGYIMVQGERWRAKTADGQPPVKKGDDVIVKESHGLTLIVQSEKEIKAGQNDHRS